MISVLFVAIPVLILICKELVAVDTELLGETQKCACDNEEGGEICLVDGYVGSNVIYENDDGEYEYLLVYVYLSVCLHVCPICRCSCTNTPIHYTPTPWNSARLEPHTGTRGND